MTSESNRYKALWRSNILGTSVFADMIINFCIHLLDNLNSAYNANKQVGGDVMNKSNVRGGSLVVGIALALGASAASAQQYVTEIDALGYRGSVGTITFDDWGITGPGGVTAQDYHVGGGFDNSQLGQIQRVETLPPDWRTPDQPIDVIMPEFTGTNYANASVDGGVNFYRWLYTTPHSEFNHMLIDKAGNYYVARDDMNWGFFNTFVYHDASSGTNSGVDVEIGLLDSYSLTANYTSSDSNGGLGDIDASLENQKTEVETELQFQPYAISDATGWCGSVLASHPLALEKMKGQLKFGVAFDVYFAAGGVRTGDPMPNLIPDFVARSYGSLEVDVTTAYGDRQHFKSSAVINNTNPETGDVDPAQYNHVSFHGAGVIPTGVWTSKDSWEKTGLLGTLKRKLNPDGTWNVTVVPAGTAGAIYYANPFAGYAFILRADGVRILEAIDKDHYTNTTNVPAGALDNVNDI
ncbi:MAG: hypothetical protein HY941_06570 [Gammaproteobacteria bacterium]|nr:hypothetical protein [Gammaproteobacteria bacterium]